MVKPGERKIDEERHRGMSVSEGNLIFIPHYNNVKGEASAWVRINICSVSGP